MFYIYRILKYVLYAKRLSYLIKIEYTFKKNQLTFTFRFYGILGAIPKNSDWNLQQ